MCTARGMHSLVTLDTLVHTQMHAVTLDLTHSTRTPSHTHMGVDTHPRGCQESQRRQRIPCPVPCSLALASTLGQPFPGTWGRGKRRPFPLQTGALSKRQACRAGLSTRGQCWLRRKACTGLTREQSLSLGQDDTTMPGKAGPVHAHPPHKSGPAHTSFSLAGIHGWSLHTKQDCWASWAPVDTGSGLGACIAHGEARASRGGTVRGALTSPGARDPANPQQGPSVSGLGGLAHPQPCGSSRVSGVNTRRGTGASWGGGLTPGSTCRDTEAADRAPRTPWDPPERGPVCHSSCT